MIRTSFTRMSSKGQIVIPESVRQRLHLKEGDVFLVYDNNDSIVLKAAPEASDKDFDSILSQAKSFARRTGIKRSDITTAIRKVRSGT